MEVSEQASWLSSSFEVPYLTQGLFCLEYVFHPIVTPLHTCKYKSKQHGLVTHCAAHPEIDVAELASTNPRV